uniref:NADH-ubiquinone oxidoreductase chain 4 n=1 Tax=Pseudoniphargus gorbeanus TaxID=1688789 RepID=A0A0M6X691_9CRUS|nr:NADH dehydrogenase subunit 4 [Pseudoniphargus gorbeanus]
MLSLCFLLVLVSFWGESILFLCLLSLFFFIKSSSYCLMFVGLFYELDMISWVLVMLSVWVICLSIMSSMSIKVYGKFSFLFVGLNMSLLLFLVMSFCFSNYLMFYLSFECSLIPIMLLILGWGHQPERSQAGVYMLFYTIFGSLPLFFLIMCINNFFGGMYMHMYSEMLSGEVFCLMMLLAFLVKFPMYSLHLWLLKAHVEAPVAGSMILAGIMLKLGGYGIIRLLPLLSSSNKMLEMLVCFSVWGGVVMSVICMRQLDMKLLIASSSVVHMCMCISGLFVLNDWGIKGCVFMMLSHGLCSSGLFCLANVVYERTFSRSMAISKGLLNLLPSLSMFWFLLVSANIAAPPTMNLLSELMLIVSLVSWSIITIIMMVGLSFFSGVYSLFLYSLSQHGVYLFSSGTIKVNVILEYMVLFLHWAPLNILILVGCVLI